MFELASDLALAQAKGRSAARVARERFDVSVMARAYERLYHELSSVAVWPGTR
jgi:glycosyltransferase involved in cell wall biosynthesis